MARHGGIGRYWNVGIKNWHSLKSKDVLYRVPIPDALASRTLPAYLQSTGLLHNKQGRARCSGVPLFWRPAVLPSRRSAFDRIIHSMINFLARGKYHLIKLYLILPLLILFPSCKRNADQYSATLNRFIADTPQQYEITSNDLLMWKARIKEIMNSSQLSEGPKFNLYAKGVMSLDAWYPTIAPPFVHRKPLTSESYYEFNFIDGYLVSTYRVDQSGRSLSDRLWHDKRGEPILCFTQSPKGEPILYSLALYNDAGLLVKIIQLDPHFAPYWITVFKHQGIYETRLRTVYQKSKDMRIVSRTFDFADASIIDQGDGKWRSTNTHGIRFWLNSLSQYGVRPLYPIPKNESTSK